MEDEFQIPRGGPIYIGNLVSPLTSVPDFEVSVLRQLQELELEAEAEAELTPCSGHDDLSVDELKVYTEEELVDMALKEAFKDDEDAQQPSKGSGNSERSREDNAESSLSETICEDIVTINNSRKRKKRKENRLTTDRYIGKVEQLAKIKQKQDEEKSTANLHSLKSSQKTNGPTSSSDKVERMKSLRSTDSAKQLKSSVNQEQVAVVYPETILCVEVYHNLRKWIKTQEFLVLGRQTLTDLRDKIYCLTDQVMQKAGQHDPSGYFLIEDAFYNDLRDPSAIDYSEPVFNWLRNSKEEALKKWECIINGELHQKQKAILGSVSNSHLPHYKAFDMHKVRFCDLRFRLGAGYLYLHQGDCKHTLVVRDMRLIHPEDVHNRAAYPIVIFQLKPRAQKCSVCKIYRATKVAVDNKWAQENPCHFCDYCFSLLYSKDGCPSNDNCSVYDYLHD